MSSGLGCKWLHRLGAAVNFFCYVFKFTEFQVTAYMAGKIMGGYKYGGILEKPPHYPHHK